MTTDEPSVPEVEEGIPAPGMPSNLAPARGGHPWLPAFLAFSRGFTLEQVAGTYGIPLVTLSRRAAEEQWADLVKELPVVAEARAKGLPAVQDIRASLQQIEANRDKNLAVFTDLRDELIKKIELLKRGEYRLEKLFHNGKLGTVVRAEQAPGPADLLNLANAAKVIAEGTYRALGDIVQAEGTGGKASAPPSSITVILPNVIARRGDSTKQAKVIDITEKK